VTSTADVVVVGGGVTGTSLAFHLARRGVRRVTVAERRFVAAGGTGRSVGIVRQLYPTLETSAMVVRSLEVFRHFADAVGGDAGFQACGVLIGVAPAMRAALERAVALQAPLGIRAELVAPGEVPRLEPRIDPRGLGAALWEPESGYGDPTAVATGYAEAARRLGVTIAQGAEVVAIRTEGGRVRAVETADGARIETPCVVDAAGLWAPAVARLAGVDLPIVVGRHPVFVVERPADFGAAHVVYLDLAGGSYARPETGGLTLAGSLGDDEAQHPMDPEALGGDVAFDEAAAVLARASAAMPALASARYRRGWAGAFDITPDWMPILDESPVGGLWIAAGLSGHGFKLAPAIGEALACRLTGADAPVDLRPFRLDRFGSREVTGTFVTSYLR
jgi:glycine/D-amino acid oxidase-like deaminating enzyme